MPICLLGTIILYFLLHRKLNATVFKMQSSVWKQIIQFVWKKQNPSVSTAINIKELRLTLLLILTVTVALISWVPPAVTYLVFVIKGERDNSQIQLLIFLFFPPLHSVVHPLLYALNLRKIRSKANAIYGKICCEPEKQSVKQINESVSNAFNDIESRFSSQKVNEK